MKLLLDLFDGALKTIVNVFFSRGIPMEWLLVDLGLDFISLKDSKLDPYDGYFIFYITPEFNLEKASNNAYRFSTWLFQNLIDESANLDPETVK